MDKLYINDKKKNAVALIISFPSIIFFTLFSIEVLSISFTPKIIFLNSIIFIMMILFIVLDVFLLKTILLKKPVIEVDDNHLIYRTLTGTKRFNLNNVTEVATSESGNTVALVFKNGRYSRIYSKFIELNQTELVEYLLNMLKEFKKSRG